MRTQRTKPERTGLAEALWPAARRAILGLLLAHPDQEWHLREIARRARRSPATIHAELRSLTVAGILARRVESRRAYYRANLSCPIFAELHQIILKTVGLTDVLREALARLAGIEVAFVYGSIARGEATSESDVDLMIVGDVTLREVSGVLHDAPAALGREINPAVYPTAEFQKKVAARHHFLTRVLEEPKLFLIGDQDELGRLAGAEMADQASR
jgi:predicted nucleotidyltransferase